MWLAVFILVGRVELGRHLFYDTRLTGNGTQSCASCHRQDLAFTDGRPHAIGSTGQVNLRSAKLLTWNNPHPQTLEEQAKVPMFGETPIELGVKSLQFLADPAHQKLRRSAQLSPALDSVTTAISASAKRGRSPLLQRAPLLFPHGGPNFSDSNQLKDNGLLPTGALFKAPTLRNISVTAPYMHDGRLPTLESVIDHYARSGAHSPTQDELIRGFKLTTQDRADLVAFLQSLTDERFLHNPQYANPW